MIKIENLHVTTEGKEILKGLNLEIRKGEIHAIMGPNGAGKSTLAKVLAGHPAYEITEGNIWFKGQEISEMDPDERACLGLFMGFQYPIEVPGVSNTLFLRTSLNYIRKSKGLPEISEEEFLTLLDKKMAMMNVKTEFKERNVNEGFSGGEKKRNEILQMAVLEPSFAVLDETDSGLDIDALKVVSEGLNQLMNKEMGLLIITHYQRLLDYIKPDFVHIMAEGKIIKSGDASLAKELEEKGYAELC